jgi:hypothetical protein
MPANVGAPALHRGADYTKILNRVMNSVSSLTNSANFVFAHKDINAVKGRVGSLLFRRAICRDANQFNSD